MLNIFSPRARSRFLDLELKRSRFLNVSVISSFLFFLFFHPPFHPLSTTASNDYHVVRIFARETVLLKTVQLTYFLPSFRMTDWNQTFLPEILAEKIVATLTFTGDEDRWHAKDFRVEILPPIVFHLSRGNKEVLEEEHLFPSTFETMISTRSVEIRMKGHLDSQYRRLDPEQAPNFITCSQQLPRKFSHKYKKVTKVRINGMNSYFRNSVWWSRITSLRLNGTWTEYIS